MKESDLTFDLDGDSVPDVIVSDTNGHTVYLNMKTVAKYVVAAVTAIVTVVLGWTQLQ